MKDMKVRWGLRRSGSHGTRRHAFACEVTWWLDFRRLGVPDFFSRAWTSPGVVVRWPVRPVQRAFCACVVPVSACQRVANKWKRSVCSSLRGKRYKLQNAKPTPITASSNCLKNKNNAGVENLGTGSDNQGVPQTTSGMSRDISIQV